jgi:hypothetical protein
LQRTAGVQSSSCKNNADRNAMSYHATPRFRSPKYMPQKSGRSSWLMICRPSSSLSSYCGKGCCVNWKSACMKTNWKPWNTGYESIEERKGERRRLCYKDCSWWCCDLELDWRGWWLHLHELAWLWFAYATRSILNGCVCVRSMEYGSLVLQLDLDSFWRRWPWTKE